MSFVPAPHEYASSLDLIIYLKNIRRRFLKYDSLLWLIIFYQYIQVSGWGKNWRKSVILLYLDWFKQISQSVTQVTLNVFFIPDMPCLKFWCAAYITQLFCSPSLVWFLPLCDGLPLKSELFHFRDDCAASFTLFNLQLTWISRISNLKESVFFFFFC